MRLSIRVFQKDLLELFHSFRGVLLIMVLPSIFLIMVAQLRSQAPSLRLLVAGSPERGTENAKNYQRLGRLLREASNLELTTIDNPALNPLDKLREGNFDLLLNIGDAGTDAWALYTKETEPGRLAKIEETAGGIGRIITILQKEVPAEPDDQAAPASEAAPLLHDLALIDVAPVSPLFKYFHSASDRTLRFLPLTIALAVCLLPIALAAPSLIREKEGHTLEILLAAPGARLAALFWGKCIAPTVLTLVNLMLMLAVAQSFCDLQIKSGMFQFVMFISLSVVASTFIGLGISASIQTTAQLMMASTVYFFGLTILGGSFFPVEEGSGLIRSLSLICPLTFLTPAVNSWMFGASVIPDMGKAIMYLLLQCLLYGCFAFFSLRRMMWRV